MQRRCWILESNRAWIQGLLFWGSEIDWQFLPTSIEWWTTVVQKLACCILLFITKSVRRLALIAFESFLFAGAVVLNNIPYSREQSSFFPDSSSETIQTMSTSTLEGRRCTEDTNLQFCFLSNFTEIVLPVSSKVLPGQKWGSRETVEILFFQELIPSAPNISSQTKDDGW